VSPVHLCNICDLMYLSINKVSSFQNCFGVPARLGSVRERVKGRFLISDVAAGNVLRAVSGFSRSALDRPL
jgi:hypothetical protein